MSFGCCTCGCGCQQGSGCTLKIVLPDNPVEQLTFENVNTLGVGVLDGTNGVNVEFRGIYSANAALLVALDAGNNAIQLTLNTGSIIDDLPQATTTQRGVGETSTDAEMIAKASITTFLTPSNLAALIASTTFSGLVELATSAETQAGVSSTLAVTPAGLASLVATLGNTVTFADAVARAAAVPGFVGQFGAEVDSDQPYMGHDVSAGSWNALFSFGITNLVNNSTTVNLDGNSLTLHSGGLNLSGSMSNTFGGVYVFDNASVSFSNVTSIDYVSVDLRIGGVQIPANSVLTTTGAGTPTSALKTAFLSSFNTSTGWTNFTNSAVRKTGDCNTITLPQLAQVVDTLIQALGTALLIPVP